MGNVPRTYYTVEDVKEIMGVAQTKAYRIIKQLNEELEQKGYITVAGKVSKKYFNERIYRGSA